MDWLALIDKGPTATANSGPLYQQIKDRLKESILCGRLPDKTKLPTNRELANLLEVDRSTVSRAYMELVSEGFIESHVGRGTYVRTNANFSTPVKNDHAKDFWTEKFSRASNTVADLISQQPRAHSSADTISFAGGIPTEDFYPHKQFEQIVDQILRSEDAKEMFNYSPAEGHPQLMNELHKLLRLQGIKATDEETLIVSGSQQAIDIVTDTLIDSEDIVILEEPSYLWAVCNFKSRQAHCLTVPVNHDGIDLFALERALAAEKPKLLYIMPNFQNPTGNSMSLKNRNDVLALCTRYGVPILEDNFAGDLIYDGDQLPPIRALPGGREMVIHQGTFSKALCPGLRTGWLVAPPAVMSRFRLAKRTCDLSTNSMAQVILAKYLEQGLYQRHLEHVREAYRRKRDTMLRAIEKYISGLELSPGQKIDWTKPRGGLFMWMSLPFGCSAKEMLAFAEREDVTFSPGDLFYCNEPLFNGFRLCFIQQSEERIEEGIKRLSRAIQNYFNSIPKTPRSNFDAQRTQRPEHVLI
jgi:DNA-binding transcriptional MocR family regulator